MPKEHLLHGTARCPERQRERSYSEDTEGEQENVWQGEEDAGNL